MKILTSLFKILDYLKKSKIKLPIDKIKLLFTKFKLSEKSMSYLIFVLFFFSIYSNIYIIDKTNNYINEKNIELNKSYDKNIELLLDNNNYIFTIDSLQNTNLNKDIIVQSLDRDITKLNKQINRLKKVKDTVIVYVDKENQQKDNLIKQLQIENELQSKLIIELQNNNDK